MTKFRALNQSMKHAAHSLKAVRRSISSAEFYGEYRGHRTEHLNAVLSHLRKVNSRIVFLAGDSSLDNKYWVFNESDAVNGYESILEPPISRQDIAYWMNSEIIQRNLHGQLATINAAVEESSVRCREKIGNIENGKLLAQDEFIRDNINENDILVISIGGNDVALQATLSTAVSLLCLIYGCTTSMIRYFSCGFAIPIAGEFFGFLSNLFAFPFGLGYFIHLFGVRIQTVIENIVAVKKPKLIILCMLYYLDEKPGNSWAERVLAALKYNSNPEKLQAVMQQIFRLATQSIEIPGAVVVTLPLYKVLDGKCSDDYCQRVEPSAKGGEKLGRYIIDAALTGLGLNDSSCKLKGN